MSEGHGIARIIPRFLVSQLHRSWFLSLILEGPKKKWLLVAELAIMSLSPWDSLGLQYLEIFNWKGKGVVGHRDPGLGG